MIPGCYPLPAGPSDPGKDQCVESVGAENEYADEWHGYVKRSETESQMEE